MSVATYQWLEQGKRLHLQHGPIDLIIEACGDSNSVASAYQRAHEVFHDVLSELVDELALLRRPLHEGLEQPAGCVAKRMVSAALPFAKVAFVTPMICVAGAVADYVLRAMLCDCSLSRAYVNNGGDIALWLADGESFVVGICDNTETGVVGSRVTLQGDNSCWGVATSGWRGRSLSLGIADAVTVLADTAAGADTAATLIANAVNVAQNDSVDRQAAVELDPDSDLGDRLVTVGVDKLERRDVLLALENGGLAAQELSDSGLIESAYMSLQGSRRVCSREAFCAGALHA